MAKRHDLQFRLNAVRYYEEHKELGLSGCAEKFGIAGSTMRDWFKKLKNSNNNESPISGNDCSNKCAEVKRLKSEVEVLKKAICILGQ